MKLTILATMALAAGSANAFFRLRCEDRVALMRSDPIVNPNSISAHTHAFHGPNTINSKSTFDSLTNNDCSSCAIKQDNSAYWTPALYYVKDGKTYAVNQKGGMLVYYHFYNGTKVNLGGQNWGNENIDVFPTDFKMIAGDQGRRAEPGPDATEQEKLAHRAVGFNCLRYGPNSNVPAEGSLEKHGWRTNDWKECVAGIRAELYFPSCWDGRSDSANHRDHMAYPDELKFGKCPDSHPKHVPALFFETIWDTPAFNKDEFEGGEFVWANGDPTGYGYHGDFQNGWKVGVMEELMKEPTCYSDDPSLTDGQLEKCKVFKTEDIRSKREMEQCKADSEWNEDVGTGSGFMAASSAGSATLTALPGCVDIARGPERAPQPVVCGIDGKPIDGTTAKPAEGALKDDTKGKGVKTETPKPEAPKVEATKEVESKPEPATSTIEEGSAAVTPVSAETSLASSTTSSNKYLVVVTTTMTKTVTEGEPEPTPNERLRRRHAHGKLRRHHNH